MGHIALVVGAFALALASTSHANPPLDPGLSVTAGGMHYQLADAKADAVLAAACKSKAAGATVKIDGKDAKCPTAAPKKAAMTGKPKAKPAAKKTAAPMAPKPPAAVPAPAPAKTAGPLDRGLDAVGRVVSRIVHFLPCAIARSDGLSPGACKS